MRFTYKMALVEVNLWDKIMLAGEEFNLNPGHTSSIRRIEGGMLSYHADMDINTNPFEVGMDRLINLDIETKFIGQDALRKIKANGIKRKQVGLIINCEALEGPNTTFWKITKNNKVVGKVTSAIYSPRLKKNIALAMVSLENSRIDTTLNVETSFGPKPALVVEKPFYDPKKKITASSTI